ncbi:MAG TPA: hypothetical protein VIU16_07070, partial [Gaiellaceae bacterium]
MKTRDGAASATIEAARRLGIRIVLARCFYDWDGAPAAYRETIPQAIANFEALAKRYQDLVVKTAEAWAGGKMATEDGSTALINWLLTTDPVTPTADAPMNELASRRATLEAAVPEPHRVMALA